MAEKYIPLFLDINETTEDMTCEEFGRLIRAMISYASGDEYEEWLKGFKEKFAFRFLKGQIDRNAEISATRAQSGAKGGKQNEANENKIKQNEANGSKSKQNEANENKIKQNEANSLTNTNTKTETNTETNTETETKSNSDTDSFFTAFWSIYPKKVSKQEAEKAWKKLKPSAVLMGEIMVGLQKWKESDQWNRDGGQYIPNPATWLNGRRWEDEVPAPRKQEPAAPVRPAKQVVAQQYKQRAYDDVQAELIAEQDREMEEWLRNGGGA